MIGSINFKANSNEKSYVVKKETLVKISIFHQTYNSLGIVVWLLIHGSPNLAVLVLVLALGVTSVGVKAITGEKLFFIYPKDGSECRFKQQNRKP